MEAELKVLKKEDFPILQALLVRCSDYLIFQDEEPIKSTAAQDLFNYRPEGVEDKEKVLLGIFVDGQEQLVDVFELIKGYPVPNTLTLALMVLEHFSRGKGIGSKAYEAVEEWAISRQHIMNCSSLKYPLLLEIEKSAKTLDEAFRQELELTNFLMNTN